MNKTIIIAEAGVNHNGSIEIAKKLIDVAATAGVDYVKFQTFKTELAITKEAPKAEYQRENLKNDNNSQFDMVKKLELSDSDHLELIQYCTKKNVKFFSTAFDLVSVDFLASLHLGLWKIPSGEITNYPYLKKIASFHEAVILSTGMCGMSDIENALHVLLNNGLRRNQITILHCNTEYPTPMEDVNLNAMRAIANKFGVDVGYSDHTRGYEVPIAAVALGAKIIEKHFTLDRDMEGPDHKASLEPSELTAMVSAIRNIEKALGCEEKRVSDSERKNIIIARKSVVAATSIKAGEIFTGENLTVKRPGNGISPMQWEDILGKIAKRDFQPDELIEL